jgi:hypothetical protein
VCGRDFAGTSYFDAHRVGVHAYDYSPDRPDGRRCADDDELLAMGIRRATDEELFASTRTRKRAGHGVGFYFNPAAAERMRGLWAEEEAA